ncbi:hypothetical protein [Tepidibacter aestuarii]|uniref:hypothetical protein n=1 Tax=Tepidibacter aestuarii TaxID=2925782 RepID=UPI0020C01014|nr:hypothetical protein [Tepidibacter aestuarii]CAH2214048.1 conserved exported protein of unknown function [Tepidibacter aestuarii]
MKKILVALICILFFSTNSFANENIDDWKFSKEIYHNNDNKYKSFLLDEEIYRYAKDDLLDIRIINDKNEFLPYYVVNKYSKKTKQADFNIKQENNDTIIIINNKDNLNINDIKIISQDDFKRNYDIYYKNNKYEEFQKIDYGNIYKINLENYKEEKNVIKSDLRAGYFLNPDSIKVVIHNKDDRPINIQDIQISYYVDKIVFKKDNRNEYTVLFGNKYSQIPSYDIQSYKDYIEKENQEICTLSNLTEENTKDKNEEDKKINYKLMLNIIVVLISLILVMVIMKKSNDI